MSHSYPSDISREQFVRILPTLASARRRTKPRTVDLYDVFCGVLYLLNCVTLSQITGNSWGHWVNESELGSGASVVLVAGSPLASIEAWSLSGVLGAQARMIVQVGSIVHVVAAQDTMTANSTDGMSILVLGVWDLAEAAGGLVAAGTAITASLAAALASLGDGAGFPFYYGGH